MAARNPTELKQLIRVQKIKTELKTLCLLQLQKKAVPYTCYEWLTHLSSKEKTLPMQYLDERCQEFSIYLKTPVKIKKILQNRNLSPFCRKKVRQQKRLVEYQLRDSPTSNLFMWYLTEDF